MKVSLFLVLAAVSLMARPCLGEEAAVVGGAQRPSNTCTAESDPAFWGATQSGWWWYKECHENDSVEKRDESPVKKEASSKKSFKEMTAAEVRKETERLHEIAVMNPTDANVRHYLEFQDLSYKQSEKYAEVWKRIVWTTPSLNPAVNSPSTTAGINVKEEVDQKNRVATAKDLSKRYGLFFFFKSDCPYCHKMAPILLAFSKQYNFEVFPISLDGGGLPEFPHPQSNNGMAEKLDVETVPAVFLGDRNTADITPIAFGVVAETELLDRIYVLTQSSPNVAPQQ